MKRSKITATLLIASMLLPMTGCGNKEKQAVLKVTEDYAQAMLSGDEDDISSFMKDDEAMHGHSLFTQRDSLSEVYDTILGSLQYEIHEDSVEIDNKRGVASVEITYTVIDYMGIYEENADDFVNELESSDKTKVIEQKIYLIKEDDEWLIDDDEAENYNEIYDFYEEIFTIGWGGFVPLSTDRFSEIIEDSLGISPTVFDFYDTPDQTNLNYTNGTMWLEYYECNDNASAREQYELYRSAIEGVGIAEEYSTDTDGYILGDGGDDIIAAIYLDDNVVFLIYASTDGSSSADEYRQLVEDMGYPAP